VFHYSLEETINAKNRIKDLTSEDKNEMKRNCSQRFLTDLIRYRLIDEDLLFELSFIYTQNTIDEK
jgi:hypothetical protein